jgi:hypothetical protein
VSQNGSQAERGAGLDLVVGLGETGQPLLDILAGTYPAAGRDLEPVALDAPVAVLHACYPYSDRFVATTADYIAAYRPQLTIVHATVAPGTTRAIAERSGGLLVYSPIRGKHTRMRADLLHYAKYVAGSSPEAEALAEAHLAAAGFQVRRAAGLEALELAKLVETTTFGLLIAWAQEVERLAAAAGAEYDDVMALTEEVPYLPPVVFRPGYIGGHCVIPNTGLLDRLQPSAFTALIRASNERKAAEWRAAGADLDERLAPRPARR